jgi:hypothetical protein
MLRRARATPDERRPGIAEHYFVGSWRRTDSLTLLSQRTSDGARAVLVFQDATAAEAYPIVEGLGPEWEVLEQDNREAANLLLTCAARGVKYIALNPPSALTRGHEEHPLIPIRVFVDGLTER